MFMNKDEIEKIKFRNELYSKANDLKKVYLVTRNRKDKNRYKKAFKEYKKAGGILEV